MSCTHLMMDTAESHAAHIPPEFDGLDMNGQNAGRSTLTSCICGEATNGAHNSAWERLARVGVKHFKLDPSFEGPHPHLLREHAKGQRALPLRLFQGVLLGGVRICEEWGLKSTRSRTATVHIENTVVKHDRDDLYWHIQMVLPVPVGNPLLHRDTCNVRSPRGLACRVKKARRCCGRTIADYSICVRWSEEYKTEGKDDLGSPAVLTTLISTSSSSLPSTLLFAFASSNSLFSSTDSHHHEVRLRPRCPHRCHRRCRGTHLFAARGAAPSVELNDVDLAAVNYLAARGLLDEGSLEARGLFGKSKDKGKGKDESSSKQELTIAFHDASGPVSAATQKEITKVLKKQISKENQKKFPFCDVTVGDGGSGTYRCFETAAKKIGEQGPAGAFKV
ncbi:hypothetical protein LXA43DRAFT_1061839 [Ganoderma leucocontextum]|nr:hypothetical protein LXA43DRAFT_1061839 [Ganoderma leucocontextum]